MLGLGRRKACWDWAAARHAGIGGAVAGWDCRYVCARIERDSIVAAAPLRTSRGSVTRHQQDTRLPRAPGLLVLPGLGLNVPGHTKVGSRLSRQRRGRLQNCRGRCGSASGWRCLHTSPAAARHSAARPGARCRPRSLPVQFPVPRGAAMAGSRAQKIGSVFSRTRNLVRLGLLEKPLWLDVYAAFPPLREPVYRVPRPRYGSARDPIAPIFYREDAVRARFYQVYGNGPRPFDLTQLNFKSTCQRFVEKYNELKEEGKIEEEKLFEETGKALLASGVILQRRGVDKVAQQEQQSAASRDPALQLQLQNVLEELQEKRKDRQEQPPELAGTHKESPPPS
ncbi:28S ribosomal protein S23, mitochondrial [Catharus ustulatus]|uniref:28S ribosomal protein S23, mitochondrial n=1 Tax=Catharus ustulatus TaxID=91951 RepID=UPI001C5B4CA7|nr:28S ribosomal protein S23, mitochondrial [Catharus ustulatus]